MLTYPEMIVVGLLQGVSELFPVSSLGHSVLLPALLGGRWARDLDMSAPGSPYLDTLVAMHVATAAALVIFFWADWVRLIGALISSLRQRRITTIDQRLAWLLVAGTIPVGLAGLALDKIMREHLGKPGPAAVFLTINGIVLYAVERLQRRPRSSTVDGISSPVDTPSHSQIDQHAETLVIPADIDTNTPAHQPRQSDRTEQQPGDATLARLGWASAPAKSLPCCRGSAAPAPPSPAGCYAASPTRTPPGSRSSWPPRPSLRPAC
jgi:hypothetical protein